ncbi:MAG: FlgD immunoglobulin-like domain containing protein, partial [Patescibacteria group bacterium]
SYIGNGNFTSGVACWTPRYINLQWPGFTVQDDHSARLDVNGGHNYYEYTLLQPCAPLPTNRQLQLDLTLGAASPCSVFIAVGSEAKHNFHLWKGYALRRLVDLPVHETITVTTPNPVDTLYLYAGKSTSSVWVKQISLKDGATQSVAEVAGDLVLAPNPMKGAGTVMRLTLETPANVLVEVYNVSGQRVRVLYDGRLQPGPRSIFWDGQDEHGTRVPSGLYFTRCRMNERTYTKTLIVVR